MRRILITGGAVGDIPLIKTAKQMGFFVITSGNRPDDIGHNFSDSYIYADYTDVDALIEIMIYHEIKFIVPSAHDLAYVAASKVAEKLNLGGFDDPEIASMIHDKGLLRENLNKNGLPVPKYKVLGSEKELDLALSELDFPLILKPVDLTGGNGVTRVANHYEAQRAFSRAFDLSLSKKVIVEEYLIGSYHGMSVIIKNKKIVFCFFDNEYYLYDDTRVSCTSYPSNIDFKTKNILIKLVEKFAALNNLVDGLLHIQLIVTKKGPFILEICRRTPGDLYPYFVESSTSRNYSMMILENFIGENEISRLLENTSFDVDSQSIKSLRLMLMPQRRGILKGIRNNGSITPDSEFMLRQPGDFIENPRVFTLGIFFYTSESQNPFDINTILEIKNGFQVQIN